ncbi:hypothetical protein ACROYT_G018887 [Oculina patagonica]
MEHLGGKQCIHSFTVTMFSSGSDFAFYFHSLLDQSRASRHVEDLGSLVDSIPRNCTRVTVPPRVQRWTAELQLHETPSKLSESMYFLILSTGLYLLSLVIKCVLLVRSRHVEDPGRSCNRILGICRQFPVSKGTERTNKL